ncbi:HNH endonuclease [Nostoc sp. FACHB-87]|uniref:RNA-guided endonuclease IscB n=1 Tax=Nostocaceae TaxID=1162 RepID=UPI001683A7B4|nr:MULTISPECIES: RNA-guided endonuclease IscB [Nostocaceae]MBD2457066.1 HNH endonuclease [Nostoc sp. FACHB-87]MBD2478252.1 HNH endonuclease [Anabaena sp. FACHB-83]
MSNFVFTVDTNKQPLNPVHPGQARRLLNLQQAAVYRRYPFTIILKYAVPNPEIQTHQLKIDPGSKTTGLAILQSNKVLWGAELTHRGQQIKNNLESRRAIRRNRRNRKTRYRKPRFLNRTRKPGWLPPSLESRVKNILTWVKRITRYVPITGISQELVKFNLQSMQNPEISGKEYQQGELTGYEIKEYLLEKWDRKCAYCGVENVPLEVDHIHPKSKGGSDRISNLTIACHRCNQAKSNKHVKDFLAKKPDVLFRILRQAKQPLKDAAAVNSTRWVLFNTLKQTGLPVEIASSSRTKYNRIHLNLPKTHWLDAACVGLVEKLQVLTSQPLLIAAKGWGSRQMCTPNKYGFPIKHKTRCKTFFGFQTGDMVRAILPSGKFAGIHVGRLTVRESGVFEMRTAKGKVSPVRYKYCKSIQRNDGYMYAFSINVR